MTSQDFQFPHPHFTYFNYTFQSHSLSLLILLLVFIAIFLLALFSCFFHSRFCNRHLTTTTNTNNNIDAISSLRPQAHLTGLDSDTISSLPAVVHSALSNELEGLNIIGVEETECSICLDGFEDKEVIKVLPKCNHAYHSECLDKWLSSRSSCPLCRESLLTQLSQGEVTVDQV